MKKALILLTVTLSLLFSAAIASAEMVTNWNYTVTGTFGTDYVSTHGNHAGIVRALDGSSLSWGDVGGSAFSAIYMHSVANTTGGLITNGPDAMGMTIEHRNQIISGTYASLSRGSASVNLSLAPFLPAGSQEALFSTVLNFRFFETDNHTAYPDDIFVLTSPMSMTGGEFEYQGYIYTFSFAATFTDLTLPEHSVYYEVARNALGAPVGTQLWGWITTESQDNTLNTVLNITARAVPTPEPGTLALLGIGLAGFGLLARRRNR